MERVTLRCYSEGENCLKEEGTVRGVLKGGRHWEVYYIINGDEKEVGIVCSSKRGDCGEKEDILVSWKLNY